MSLIDIIVKLHQMQEVQRFELYSECPRCMHLGLHLLIDIDSPTFKPSGPVKKPGVLEDTLDNNTIASIDYAGSMTVRRLITRECRQCNCVWQELFEDIVNRKTITHQLKAGIEYA